MLSYIETSFETKNANGIAHEYAWLDKHPDVRAVGSIATSRGINFHYIVETTKK